MHIKYAAQLANHLKSKIFCEGENGMELFPLTLPKSNICMETALYYRSSRPVQYDEHMGQIIFDKKTTLTFDTYFNCFSYQKYLQYTGAHVLEVHLQLQGEVQLRLMKAELSGKKVQRTVLLTQTVMHQTMDAAVLLYDFGKESGNGILYLELTALSKTVVFGGGFYASPMAESELQPVKIAAVICTYKREDYVQRNLRHLRETVLAQPQAEIARHMEVFVVDNGQTLQRDKVESLGIRLFPNKNLGGSGGFTRGIIEALRRREEFSHVLLMDDDILLESNVLVKTIRFLQIVRPEHQDLAIGGSMLRLDDMAVQHEAGGKWTGRKIVNLNKGFNLCNVSDLLKNELDNHPDYNAWWYACLPLCLIDENNLPLPLFVREDDVEYGIRLFHKWLLLNGIGVWHEPFDKKDNFMMDYYNVRNQMILNAIHCPKNYLYQNIYILVRFVGKALLRHHGNLVDIAFKGINDFLQGFDFIKESDEEQVQQELRVCYNELEKKEKKLPIYYWLYAGVKFLFTCGRSLIHYSKVVKQYQNRKTEIMSLEYWNEKYKG